MILDLKRVVGICTLLGIMYVGGNGQELGQETLGQPVYRLQFTERNIEVPTQIRVTARRTSVTGKAQVLTAVRRVYKKYWLSAGPWSYSKENTSFANPNKDELTDWAAYSLCRIGAEGIFSGTEANEIMENPFYTEKFVKEAVIDKSTDSGQLFYHNIKISWEAKMWKSGHAVHLSSTKGVVTMFLVDGQGKIVRDVKAGRFIKAADHVSLVLSVPTTTENYVQLRCYQSQINGLTCEDEETGLVVHFSQKERNENWFLEKCVGGKCYRFQASAAVDTTPRRTAARRAETPEREGEREKTGNYQTTVTPEQTTQRHRRGDEQQTTTASNHLPQGNNGFQFAWDNGVFRQVSNPAPSGIQEGPWVNHPNTLRGTVAGGDFSTTWLLPAKMQKTKYGEVDRVPALQNEPHPQQQTPTGAQNFVRVDFPEGSEVSREDMETIQGDLIQDRQERQYNEATLMKKIEKLEFILSKVYNSLAKIDPKFVSSTLPELHPFETTFLNSDSFQIKPAPQEPDAQTNCDQEKIFQHGRWIPRQKSDDRKCVTWENVVDFPIFEDLQLQEAALKTADHVTSLTEDRQSWDFLAEHTNQMKELDQVFQNGGLSGTALSDVISFGPGQITKLLNFTVASATIGVIIFTIIAKLLCWCTLADICRNCCKPKRQLAQIHGASEGVANFGFAANRTPPSERRKEIALTEISTK